MAVERTYIIPLRREWLRSPKYRRAKKAVIGVRNFLSRHMKQEDMDMIKIGPKLNEALWARGIKSPPPKIKITVIKEDDGLVKAELFGHKYVVKKKIEKKEEETGIAGKLKSALGAKEEKEETAEKIEEPKEEVKKEKPKKKAKPEKPKKKEAKKK